MALDTATKRRSMFAMGVLPVVVHPVPDATIASIDQKHFLGLMASIATQTALATTALHIFSTSNIEPDHVTDSGDNVLVAGDIEVQGNVYAGNTFLPNDGLHVMGDLQNEAWMGWVNAVGQLQIGSSAEILLEAATFTRIGGPIQLDDYAKITSEGVISEESLTGSRPLLRYSLMGV